MKMFHKKVLSALFVFSLAVSCFAIGDTVIGTVMKKDDSKKPGQPYYYISFNTENRALFPELESYLKQNQIGVPDNLYDSTNGSSEIGPHMSVYDDMLLPPHKREGLVGQEFKFYPISGYCFWESLNHKYDDLKIWIVKILIPIGKAKEVFDISEKGTPHISVGSYSIPNPYKNK